MNRDELQALLTKVVQDLGEHFDSVQIIATHYEGETGTTRPFTSGIGNWYARHASAEEFVRKGHVELLADEIAAKGNPPDDSEEWKSPAN